MSEYQRKPDERETAAPLPIPGFNAPSSLPPVQHAPSEQATQALAQLHIHQRQRDVQVSVARSPEKYQRQAAPVLQALAVQREVVRQQAEQQAGLQRQISGLESSLPGGAIEAAVQRLAGPQPLAAKPSRPADWVQVAQLEVQRVQDPKQPELTRMLSTADMGQHRRTLQTVSQQLAQGFKADRSPPMQRYAEYGEQLATLQRQALTKIIPRHFMTQIPAAERPSVQRAMDEALQRLSQQDSQDQQALTLQTLQRQLAKVEAEAEQPIMAQIQARRGSGSPLPETVQRHLEAGLNFELSNVRIHDDAEADLLARKMHAVAFTTGQDIYFQKDKFNPNTQSGLELIAHEVTHVKQQASGQVGKGVDPDAGLETEARRFGQQFAAGLNGKAQPQLKGLALPSLAPSPYAPGVYTPQAALGRVQSGVAHAASLHPFAALQRQTDGSIQRWGVPGFIKDGVNAVKDGAGWVADKAADGAAMLADKFKATLSSGLSILPGYKELCLTFGKDVVTGKAMAQNPTALLDALANFVPGPLKDIIKAVKESGALPKAFAWFQAQLGKLRLGSLLSDIGGAIKSLSLDKAKAAVLGRVSTLKGIIAGSAQRIADIVLTAISAGLGPVGQKVMASLRSSGDVLVQVLKNPGKFAGHLMKALQQGFGQFGQHAPKHFQNGVAGWLTGSTGIALPTKLDIPGLFMTAMTIAGLTYQNFRGRLSKAVGEQKVKLAEGSLSMLQTLKGGLHKDASVKGQQSAVGNEVLSGIKGEVQNSLILAGIRKVVTMLIPGGGFLNAIIGAFQSVQFVIQRGSQIASVIMSGLSSVGAIAAGNISGAAGLIERTMAGSIPIALGFVAKLVGIGNLGGKIKGIFTRVRGKLDALVDKLVLKVKGLIGKIKTGATNTAAKAKQFLSGIFGKKSFTAGKEGHSVWVDMKGGTATLMIASTPREATQQLLNFAKGAKTSLGADPQGIYGKFIQPKLSYAMSAVNTEKQKLKTVTSALPPEERKAKLEMGVKASNITSRVGELTKNLLDEVAKHASNTATMPMATLSFPLVSRSGTRYDLQELRLQLGEQENALRRMTVAEWLKRYPYYPGASRSGKQAVKKLDARARVEYRSSEAEKMKVDLARRLVRQFIAEGKPNNIATLVEAENEAKKRVADFMKTQAALHLPDKIVGGDYLLDINGVGDADVNSFIGSQWKSGDKVGLIKANCERVDGVHRATTHLNVRLEAR